MSRSENARFGFLARFNLDSSGEKPTCRGFSPLWAPPLMESFADGESAVCLGKNPLLDELVLVRMGRRSVILDGRIDDWVCEERVEQGRLEDRVVEALLQRDDLSTDFARGLIGDFAIVKWDGDRRVLHLGRDIFGCRALFYEVWEDCVTVSSDLKLLVSHVQGPLRLDTVQARAWMIPTVDPVSFLDRTILHGVRRVAPGTILEVSRSGVRCSRYWQPSATARLSGVTLDDAVRLLSDSLSRAVADRIPSDRRFACHLSGGLDCSTVSGAVARNHPDAVSRCDFVSWTPTSASAVSGSELDIIKRLAEAWKIRVVHLDAAALEAAYREWNSTPFDPSQNPTMVAFERVSLSSVSAGCATMLSGWGGDEFASSHGWGLPMELLWSARWAELAAFLVRTDRHYGVAAIGSSIIRLLRWLLPASAMHIRDLMFGSERGILGDPFRFRLRNENYYSSVRSAQSSAYWSGHLTERIEAWAALGRSHGVQYAYPLLDRRVVELALAFPGSFFGSSRESRVLFRRLAGGIWPDGLAYSSRKREPSLAAMIGEFAPPAAHVLDFQRKIVDDVLSDPEIVSLLPFRMRRALRKSRSRQNLDGVQPSMLGLQQLRDSMRWIRAANRLRG